MTRRDEWVVGQREGGSRLDRFLAGRERLGSRGRALSALDRGKVFLNGDEVGSRDAGAPLRAGDRVQVWMDRPGSAGRRPPGRISPGTRSGPGLEILFEDRMLLVVAKPAGLLTVPLARRPEAPSVYGLLVEHFRSRKRTPHVVHRIDRDTSGLVVFAKDGATQQALKAQFLRREPERVYLAVVVGHPSPIAGTWRDRLAWHRDELLQQPTHARDPRGAEAVSVYRVVERLAGAALLEVRLHTGKRNQIRVQAAIRGHPLVGERQYATRSGRGSDGRAPAFARQALHAWRLRFDHPVDGRPLAFEAPLPADMATLVARLREPA